MQQVGWAGLENGELLRRAGEHFDVLLTGDQNIDLVAVSNRIEALRPLIPELLQTLPRIPGREFVRVSAEKRTK